MPMARPTIYLGQTLFEDTFFRRDICDRTDGHLLTLGCPGSGKSTTAVWPNLAMYQGSMLVLDPKGEHARMTMWRRQAPNPAATSTRYHLPGGVVYVLDAFGELRNITSARCNVLVPLDIDSPRARSGLSAISDGCVIAEDPKHQHFADWAALLLEGAIAHVKSRHPKEHHNLPFVADLLVGLDHEHGIADPQRFDDLITAMRTNNVAGGIAQLAAAKLEEMGPNERGSVLSTLGRSLKWVSDPSMRVQLSGNDCCLTQLAEGDPAKPVTVYVVLPLAFMKEQSRWMRTITNVTLNLIQSAPIPPERTVVCLLDEFAQLGTGLKKIQEGIVTLRSANVKIWAVAQSVSQLKAGLGAEWETFYSSATSQVFGIRDLGTAEWISRMLGKRLQAPITSRQIWRRRAPSQDRGQSQEICTPEEVMEELGKVRPMQYVFPTEGLPMRLERLAFKPLKIEGYAFRGLPLQGHFED